MGSFLLLLALGSSPLEDLAAKLQQKPAWEAEFVQTFVPAGLSKGTEEKGRVWFAHPSRVRFEYTGKPRRVFAVDGAIARMVDFDAGTCHASHLPEETWASLPLAGLSDPGAVRSLFQVEEGPATITLVPRQESQELARVEVKLGSDGLPHQVVVEDGSGNRNVFRFSQWRTLLRLEASVFSPGLPGQAPCLPRDDNPANQR